jgi:hypothetical protein
MSKQNIKWKIISIEVSEENQIIPIDFKLANDIGLCKGVYLSVRQNINTPQNSIPQIGELSLMFNAKSKHPLHITASYSKDLSSKKKTLELNCNIESNTNITGFYIDYAQMKDEEREFQPYTLSIYLQCYSKDKIPTK